MDKRSSLKLSCKEKNVFFRILFSPYSNGMGSFSHVGWVVSSVAKTIRGVPYPTYSPFYRRTNTTVFIESSIVPYQGTMPDLRAHVTQI